MIITIIQGLWKEGIKKIVYYEGAYGHMVLWNFRLCFEPLGLPPLKKSSLKAKKNIFSFVMPLMNLWLIITYGLLTLPFKYLEIKMIFSISFF